MDPPPLAGETEGSGEGDRRTLSQEKSLTFNEYDEMGGSLPTAPQAGFVRRPVANDLLFSGMKKAGKKILWLLMLLWKNYGGGRPAAIQTRPDRQSLVMGSDRIAAQAFPLLPPPCFSHKTLRGRAF